MKESTVVARSPYNMTLLTVVLLAMVGNVFGGSASSNRKSDIRDESWLRGESSLLAIGPQPADDTSCTTAFSCSNCHTAKVCRPDGSGGFTLLETVSCPPERPYCNYDTGTCTTVPASTCGGVDDFSCLEDGYFPDNNCTVYHVCKDLQAHKFECIITGQVYNAETKRCEASDKCGSYNCTSSGIKASHSIYPHYYTYCGESGAAILLSKCKGLNKLNMTSQLCEPMCEKDGILQDIEDCTKYYECKSVWTDTTNHFMTRKRLNCPADTGYSPDDFMCISLRQLPGCNVGIPPELKD